jgi:hypothetical protein
VDDAGLIPVDASHYSALPAALYSEVTVRIYEREIEILDAHGAVLRRHDKSAHKGAYVLPEEDRIFNPSRETARLIGKVRKIGPHCTQLAREIFARLGRPGQKAIYGLANLSRHHSCEDIERACEKVLLRISRKEGQRFTARRSTVSHHVGPVRVMQDVDDFLSVMSVRQDLAGYPRARARAHTSPCARAGG